MQSWSWIKDVRFSKALTPFISFRHIVLFTFFPVIVSYQVVCLFRDISLNARDASLHFLTPCQDVFAKMSADSQFQTDPPTNFKFWKETYIRRETFQADLPLMVSREKYFCATLAIHNNYSVQLPPTHLLLF